MISLITLKLEDSIVNRGYYFPVDLDDEIKQLISDYIDAHTTTNVLSGHRQEFEVVNAAQKGFTVVNGSIVFRVLIDYKGREGEIAVNFPNWRGWEDVLPLNSKNHFCIGGYRKKSRTYGRFNHGYYDSFRFKNKEEFIKFFNKYMMGFAIS